MSKVFLGGTCNGSQWREELIPSLTKNGLDYFNPVVDDWNEECYQRELREREACDYCMYTITPKMTGVYSIAEVVDDSNKRPEKTVLVILEADDGLSFEGHQMKALKKVAHMVENNGGQAFFSLKDAARVLE